MTCRTGLYVDDGGGVVVVLALTLLACGGGSEQSLVSKPSPATVDLSAPEPEITWSDLEGLFTRGPMALPPSLQDARFGMDSVACHGLLSRAGISGMRVAERTFENHDAYGTGLLDYENVGFTLILGGTPRALESIDLSLPEDQAILVLQDAWGDAASVTMRAEAEGGPVYVWHNADRGISATLRSSLDGRAVLKFEPAGP